MKCIFLVEFNHHGISQTKQGDMWSPSLFSCEIGYRDGQGSCWAHLTQRLFGDSMGTFPEGQASMEWDECWVALTWKFDSPSGDGHGDAARFMSKDAARTWKQQTTRSKYVVENMEFGFGFGEIKIFVVLVQNYEADRT